MAGKLHENPFIQRWTGVRQYTVPLDMSALISVVEPVLRYMTGTNPPGVMDGFDVIAAGKSMNSHGDDGQLQPMDTTVTWVEYLRMLVPVSRVEWIDHHWAHATSAMYEVPASRMLIFSYDGLGNDGARGWITPRA